MTMKMFMSPDNQANELNRFFFELTPSGVLFVIFSLALTVFLYWIFVSIYKNTIAKTKLFQKIFKTGHPSIPNSGYDNVDFYFMGILVSSLPVLCVFFLSFSHISLFQVYSRETEAIDSIKRKDIFEQYDSKVVVTYYNDSYSNHTDNEVRNVILVLEKKDKSSFYPNSDYFKPAERIKYSIRSIGERGFVVTETRDIKPIFPFTYHKFFINKEEAPEVYQKILKYKKEIELKNEREN